VPNDKKKSRLMWRLRIFIYLILLILLSCSKKEKQGEVVFEQLTKTGIDFSNTITNNPDFNIFSYRNFYNGGGAAIGDINNDGMPDVFFTANMGSNKLYLNKGNWKFDDISTNAGFRSKQDWSTGVVMVDINSDGWLDIFVCNAGYINGKKPVSQLFINNRNLTFTDSAAAYNLTNEGGYTTHAAFFDYDIDGDLDCFIINNSFIPVNTLNYASKRDVRASDWPVADFLKGGGDHLLRNDNGKFVDVGKESGIYGSLISFGLGVTVGDVNGDHYPDVYVSNDFFERDYLYINQRNGTFKDELEQWVQHISLSSMGADMADINNDGYPDIFTTDMLPDNDYRLKTTTSYENIDILRLKQKTGFYNQYTQNTLQINNQDGKFMEAGFYSGVAASDWSWGGLIFDADNDGLSDIYVCNGILNDVTDQDFIDFFANHVMQKMALTGEKEKFDEIVNKMPSRPIPNKFFHNTGYLKFKEEGNKWGFATPSFSNGAAYGDLDNDGDLDLIVNNVNEKAFIYRNNSREQQVEKNNYIAIVLKGDGKNTKAVGSQIKIYQGSQVMSREVIPSRGFQSSVDYKQIIGLGNGMADSMIIIWPDRTFTKYDKPLLNKVLEIKQEAGKPISNPIIKSTSSLLVSSISPFDKHTEDDYIDFYNERNVPMMLSREGPQAATADVNGDGLIDIYIAGATGQAGQLYVQTQNGFQKKEDSLFLRNKGMEDVAVLFFDADKDGDADLFIGAGGNTQSKGSPMLRHRLYKNDGKGNFSETLSAFPANNMNVSVAIYNDFDKDGDNDLFIGVRNVPMSYGTSASSFLYMNDGSGKFTDVTASILPGLNNIGMVTAACWADVNGDKIKELIVAGEWMNPEIFTYRDKKFEKLITGLIDLSGWWKSIAVSDLDGDGDNDLVMGNCGENFYLNPSAEKPAKLWIYDFDQNGTSDKIITRNIDGRDMPVFLKRELTEQMPSLKKQNLKYAEYATKSIQQLFNREALKKSEVREFNYPSSCIAINDGNGKFSVIKLPPMVQMSCVNAILCTDINNDGKVDLLMGGNDFNFLPQFSRMDASFGHVLINKGKSQFEWQLSKQSGLLIRGQIKDIKEFLVKGERQFLFLQNDDYPLLYRINKK
jgi:hypothetical protein